MNTRRAAVAVLGCTAWLGVMVTDARGAIGPRPGGVLNLPSAEPVLTIDPARAANHFEAALAEAVFDGLYEVRDAEVVPVLADGPPDVDGTTVRIRLRDGIRHHGHRPLLARQVVRSLIRTTSSPSSWLLGAFASEGGRPLIREVDERTIEIQLARRGVRADAVLAAAPLAIVAGGNLRRRPIGTGPFHARLDGRGGVELRIFRASPGGAGWLNGIRFSPMSARDEEVRAFELERLDGSWRGRTLYGGEPTRPITTTTSRPATPVILVPNRARALGDDRAWGSVVRAVDRQRLERLGVAARDTLGAGLPAPSVPSGAARTGLSLRLPVRASRATEVGIAEALASMLDERGVRLEVSRVPDGRYEQTLREGEWDLRLAFVRPPLPGMGPLAGAALAAAGQIDRARQLATTIAVPDVARRVARELGVMVLGHERVVLHHRADLGPVAFDHLGRLSLADLSFRRRSVAIHEAEGGAR